MGDSKTLKAKPILNLFDGVGEWNSATLPDLFQTLFNCSSDPLPFRHFEKFLVRRGVDDYALRYAVDRQNLRGSRVLDPRENGPVVPDELGNGLDSVKVDGGHAFRITQNSTQNSV